MGSLMYGQWLNPQVFNMLRKPVERVRVLTKTYTLLFKLKNTKKTGVLFGNPAYNDIFIKLKSGVYVPMTNLIGDRESYNSISRYRKRAEKIMKYYTSQQYKNIEGVHIIGEDPYLALPHLLSFWIDYDLIRPYYKSLALEKIEQTLWAYSLVELNGSDFEQFQEKLLKIRRFNLYGFLDLVSGEEIPLVYKDGILLALYYTMFSDFKAYDKPTAKEVVKEVVKRLSSPNLSLKDFYNNGGKLWVKYPVIRLFPYIITMSITDYGFVLNLYKFNLKTLQYDLILIKPIHRDYEILKEESPTTERVIINDRVVTNIESIENTLSKMHYFGFDEDYVYIYSCRFTSSLALRVDINKIPLSLIDYIKLDDLILVIVDKKGRTKRFFYDCKRIYSKIKLK